MPLPLIPFAATLAAPAVFTLMQVMGAMYTDYTAAPPTPGYSWERSSAGPETTDVSQFSVLVGFAFSPLQIEQFCAAANSIYAGFSNSGFDYWNGWFANEVQEISMYDKLHNLYQDFENMIAFFPLIWKIWEIMLMQVVKVVYSKYFGRARVQLFVINNLLRCTSIFVRLFEQMVCLLWG